MNIVLIGYRGSGKSSVATMLASRLRWERVSTDTEIVARAKQSIPDIVQAFGWEYFRDLESDVCREVGAKNSLIIDTGGGAILRPQNIQALKANGRLFWLTAERGHPAAFSDGIQIVYRRNRRSLRGTTPEVPLCGRLCDSYR